MSQREVINRLLDDMDVIRPIVINAMPNDAELRAKTREMIAELETLKRAANVPMATFLWLSQMTKKFMDAEHGSLLKPSPDGFISEEARQSVQLHIKRRQLLLVQALQDIPMANKLLDQSSALIGRKARKDETLQGRARHLHQILLEHMEQNGALRNELHQLIDAFAPSMQAISSILDQAGEESDELAQAKKILEQELPDDVNEARALLQNARKSILQAGDKLTTATEKLHDTIEEHTHKLNSLSSKLERAESEARNDPLTGLANRRRLAEYLNSLAADFCFLIVDIDHFKKINDSLGHDGGDEVLQQLGKILKESVRNTDLAARIGGEEFCIVLPATSLENSHRLAETLRQAVESTPFSTRQGGINVTVSIGIAEHHDGHEHTATFKAADGALYQSKTSGRNRVTIANSA